MGFAAKCLTGIYHCIVRKHCCSIHNVGFSETPKFIPDYARHI